MCKLNMSPIVAFKTEKCDITWSQSKKKQLSVSPYWLSYIKVNVNSVNIMVPQETFLNSSNLSCLTVYSDAYRKQALYLFLVIFIICYDYLFLIVHWNKISAIWNMRSLSIPYVYIPYLLLQNFPEFFCLSAFLHVCEQYTLKAVVKCYSASKGFYT